MYGSPIPPNLTVGPLPLYEAVGGHGFCDAFFLHFYGSIYLFSKSVSVFSIFKISFKSRFSRAKYKFRIKSVHHSLFYSQNPLKCLVRYKSRPKSVSPIKYWGSAIA